MRPLGFADRGFILQLRTGFACSHGTSRLLAIRGRKPARSALRARGLQASSKMPLGPRSRHRQLYWFVALQNPDTLQAPHEEKRFADCRGADWKLPSLQGRPPTSAIMPAPSLSTMRFFPIGRCSVDCMAHLESLLLPLPRPASPAVAHLCAPSCQTTFATLAPTLLMPKCGRERAAPSTTCRPNGLTC